MKTTTIGIGLLALLGLAACAASGDSGAGNGKSNGGTGAGDGTGPGDGAGVDDPAKNDPTNPEAPPAPLVTGLAVSRVAFFQGVAVDVVKDGKLVAARNAPIVAGRPALVRVYVTPSGTFASRAVTAEMRIEAGGKKLPLVRATQTVSSASTDEDTKSTFNLEIPADYLTTDATFQVALTAPDGDKDKPSSTARFPADGSQQKLGAKAAGKVKVVVVPIQYDADGSSRLPDTSPAQVDFYRRTMMGRYPASDVEVTVHAPVSWTTPISRNGSGFSQILSAITRLRATDGAPKDVYYYGAFAPASTFSSYCSGGCVTGLSSVVGSAQTASMRASVGIGFSGYDSANTMAHEVGHAHGREHAPCGGAQGTDPDFPYAGGGIGVWGYDITSKQLFSPTRGKDMMGYCPNEWVSDYTYSALFDRVAAVNQLVGGAGGSGQSQASKERVRVRLAVADEHGDLTWSTEPFEADADVTEGGESRAAKFTSPAGIELGRRTARFFRFDHVPGGMVVVPDSAPTAASHVVVEGFTRALAR